MSGGPNPDLDDPRPIPDLFAYARDTLAANYILWNRDMGTIQQEAYSTETFSGGSVYKSLLDFLIYNPMVRTDSGGLPSYTPTQNQVEEYVVRGMIVQDLNTAINTFPEGVPAPLTLAGIQGETGIYNVSDGQFVTRCELINHSVARQFVARENLIQEQAFIVAANINSIPDRINITGFVGSINQGSGISGTPVSLTVTALNGSLGANLAAINGTPRALTITTFDGTILGSGSRLRSRIDIEISQYSRKVDMHL